MKRIPHPLKGSLTLFILIIVAVGCQAQRYAGKEFIVRDSIYINGQWVKKVTTDTASINAAGDNEIPSTKAMKEFVQARAIAGGATDTTPLQNQIIALESNKLNTGDTANKWIGFIYKRSDSFFYKKGATEYFIGKDSVGSGGIPKLDEDPLSSSDGDVYYNTFGHSLRVNMNGVFYSLESINNKSTDTALGASNTLYPTQRAVRDYVGNHLNSFYTKAQADARFLQSFTEADPTISTLIKNMPVAADASTNKYYYWANGSIGRKQILYSEISGTPDLSVYATNAVLNNFWTKAESDLRYWKPGDTVFALGQGLVFDRGVKDTLELDPAVWASKAYVDNAISAAGGYTNEQAQDAIASLIQNGTGISWTYNDASNTFTGNVSLSSFSTTNLSEGTNLYFTNARVNTQLNTYTGDVTFSGGVSTIGSGKVTNLMLAGSIDAAKINTGVVSNAEFNYLDGVTSAIQTQLNAKQATLVSGNNIKTVNGISILGSGDITISGGGGFALGGRASNLSNKAVVLYDTTLANYSYADVLLSKFTNPQDGDVPVDSAGFMVNRNAAQMRQLLGLVVGTNVQAYDADLTTYAGITPSANVQAILGAANYAAIRTLLGVSTFDGNYNNLTNKPTIPTNNNQLTNGSGYISNITGLISQGSNVTITGIGTVASPYVINASSGGSGTINSGTTNAIPKYTGATTLSESVIFDASGNVGLGTGTPYASARATFAGLNNGVSTFSWYSKNSDGTYTGSLDDAGNLYWSGLLNGKSFQTVEVNGFIYVIPRGNYFVIAKQIPGSFSVALDFPDPAANVGQVIKVNIRNSGSNKYVNAQGYVKDRAGNTIATFTDGAVYEFISTGPTWSQSN